MRIDDHCGGRKDEAINLWNTRAEAVDKETLVQGDTVQMDDLLEWLERRETEARRRYEREPEQYGVSGGDKEWYRGRADEAAFIKAQLRKMRASA